MKLLIGCPTVKRDWILPLWKQHVDAAIPDGVRADFIFLMPKWDTESFLLSLDWKNTSVIQTEESEREDIRRWGDINSFTHMAQVRNTLLAQVRQIKPDYFLSLDSDILLHSDAISNLIETAKQYEAHAVGGATFFDPVDAKVTNVGKWQDPATMKKFFRIQSDGVVHPADIIMGIKLMDNLAYNVNYEHHNLGEDLGWSKNMARAKAKIFFDGRVKNKHCMSPEWLDRIDKRVGF
jgi:hypothetical protein